MLQPTSDYHARKDLIPSPPSLSEGAQGSYSIDLREVAQILRRRRWIVIITMITLLALAILFILFVTPRYTATATVLIDPSRSNVVANTRNDSQPISSAPDDVTINSQVSLIQSIAVLQKVVDNLDLAHDPEFGPHFSILDPITRALRWIRGLVGPTPTLAPGQSAEDVAKAAALDFLLNRRLTVTRQLKNSLVDISVSSKSPEKAAKIANAIVDSYFDEQVRGRYDTQRIAATWFKRQIEDLKSQVFASDRAVEEFRAAHNLTVAQGVTVNDQQLTDLNNKLIDAHAQTAAARAKFEEVANIAKSKADPGTWALSSDVIAQLRAQYAQVARNLADVSSKFGPNHPLVVNAKAQLRATQKSINEELQRVLESTEQDFKAALSREEALRKSLDNLTRVSNESGNEQVRLRELQREAEANRTLYQAFLARFKETSAQESVDLPNSRVVSKADIPISPSFPKTTFILALTLFAGVFLGSILAFAVDIFDGRVKSLRQAEKITGVRTLAAMPLIGTRELASRAKRGRSELNRYDPNAVRIMLPATLQPPLMRYVLDEPTSLFAESIRAVRFAIQHAARTEPVKTVVVTSSIDGESKTTLSVNLALALAAVGLRTILVEGDLRNPEMSRSLCPRATVGAIEVAAGQARFEQALLIDQASGLAVLPSPPRQSVGNNEFVFSDTMSNMLEQLRKHFDYVIIDSPPLIPLVDARALAEIADRLILAIRWDSTPRDVVAKALETITPSYDRLLGTVLTRVDMQKLKFYDYYQSSAYLKPYSYLGHPRAAERVV